VAAVVAVLGWSSLRILLDLLVAAMIILAGVGPGLWIVARLPPPDLPVRWRFLLGTAAGLGLSSLTVLIAGHLGALHGGFMVGLFVAGVALGGLQLRNAWRQESIKAAVPSGAAANEAPAWPFLWLILAPFLFVSLLAVATPPGAIWSEEGYGYDALEYHLQLPKEYLQAGRIHYVPHNVYANFPSNVEMLSMWAMLILSDPLEAGTIAHTIHFLLGALTIWAAWVVGRDRSPRSGQVGALIAGSCGWLCYLSGLAYVENGVLFFGVTATGAILRVVANPFDSRTISEGWPQKRRWFGWAGICAGLACGCKYTAAPLVALPLAAAVGLASRFSWRARQIHLVLFISGVTAAFGPWLLKNQFMTGNPVFPLLNEWFQATPPGWGPEQTAQWERGHSLAPTERPFAARLRRGWDHAPADHYQRFGPMMILLAAVSLASRFKSDAGVRMLGLVLLVQGGAWLFTTHLYARFAVPMIIPLTILASRSGKSPDSRRGTGQESMKGNVLRGGSRMAGFQGPKRFGSVILPLVLVGGAAWNFFFLARLCRDELPLGAAADWFYDGRLPGFEYIGAVNHELPESAKVLLLGEARPFYFRRRVDYCVVFNRNPFADAVRAAKSPGDIMAWLRGRGYTHVLAHWTEMERLARTYGFPEEINRDLLDELTRQGLSVVREFDHPSSPRRYVTLYQVPPG
jgi:4-amino-4-deoxy-L-arabinose transferase-like glycosyltransferase